MAGGTTADEIGRSSPAVFISYASQDAVIADTIVDALEHAGVPCWIAPRNVLPGSHYADEIVGAINHSQAVVLLLSAHALASPHVGKEIERASSKQRRIITLRIDAAPLSTGFEYFLSESQWVDLHPTGMDAALTTLVRAVRRHVVTAVRDGGPSTSGGSPRTPPPVNRSRVKWIAAATAAALALGLAYLAADRLWPRQRTASATTEGTTTQPALPDGATATTFTPPPHSIAVLPFVNMSGDPRQDYFSDGLSEELLNSLASIRDLQVAARTSSFTFKGSATNVADIARKLNVGAVLEGSVRKDGSRVRITAQLINATTGFHIWSRTFDRDLANVLKLQTEIATAVTQALQATLLADESTTIEIGGTQNPKAFDAYLRGRHWSPTTLDAEHLLARIDAHIEATRLDPAFARAYVAAAGTQMAYANNYAPGSEIRSWFERARQNSERAIALAPRLGIAHAELALVLERSDLDFPRALVEYQRALALSPNDTEVLMRAGSFFRILRRTDTALSLLRQAIAQDQLNPEGYTRLAGVLADNHHHAAALAMYDRALQVGGDNIYIRHERGLDLLQLGDTTQARQSCETRRRTWQGQLCLSILYHRLGQQPAAEAELARMRAENGDSAAYQYAEIYAQWGDLPKALDWLEVAYRLPDPGIATVQADPLIDPLRAEPRFQAVLRKLAFPQ